MITADDLVAAGFKTYGSDPTLYQKRVYSDNGYDTLYFINVIHYIHSAHPDLWEVSFAFDRACKSFGYCWLKYSVNPDSTTVDDIECLARDVFKGNLGIKYE